MAATLVFIYPPCLSSELRRYVFLWISISITTTKKMRDHPDAVPAALCGRLLAVG